MLISHDRAAQLQLAKRARYLARLRQRESRISGLFSNRTSMVNSNLLGMNKEGETVKFPQIKEGQGQEKEKKGQSIKPIERKKVGEQQKLIDMIKKEMSLEKHNYFQTISSDKALIIKNSKINNQKKGCPKQKVNEEDERTLTPLFKVYRRGKTDANDDLPKTAKKMFIEVKQEESCSPWNYNQSQELTLQEEQKVTETL